MRPGRITAGASVMALLALCGCTSLPSVRAVSDAEARDLRARCEARFPPGDWRAVHAIHARLPLGQRTALIGVATWDAGAGLLRVMALALEGVTLLDLQLQNDKVTVLRAVPPLDREGFAEGLARDVKLLLLPPDRGPSILGIQEDGKPLCRYLDPREGVLDLIPGVAKRWELRLYSAQGRLRRLVEARGAAPGQFAREMSLTAPGAGGYQLTLRLLRVERGQAHTAPPPRAPDRDETSPPKAPEP